MKISVIIIFVSIFSTSCQLWKREQNEKKLVMGDACTGKFSEEEKKPHDKVPDLNLDIYVVNLESNTLNPKTNELSATRREVISKRLKELGISFKFFKAVYGKKYSFSENNKNNKLLELNSKLGEIQTFGENGEYKYIFRRFRDKFSWGELGHRLTFYELFKEIGKGSRPALILEDDAVIDDFFKAKLYTVLKSPPKDWSMIYPFCPSRHSRKGNTRYYKAIEDLFLTNIAQIIQPHFARKLADKMNPLDDFPTDEWLARRASTENVFCSCPNFIHHGNEDSTISNEGRDL